MGLYGRTLKTLLRMFLSLAHRMPLKHIFTAADQQGHGLDCDVCSAS